jgi:hypothetical protein
MTAQLAITRWTTEAGRRCIPPYIRVDELMLIFDWLKLSPKMWAKMKVEGIPPHIEQELEIRLHTLESFRQMQKPASSAGRDSEVEYINEDEEDSSACDNVFVQQSSTADYLSIASSTSISKPSLQGALEKIESPRRTRTLIAAMLDDIRMPSIDCDPIKSNGLHNEILSLLYARSTNANSIAAKDLVFHLIVDARRYRRNGRIDLALELEFIASAIDLIAYRNMERTYPVKKLWF